MQKIHNHARIKYQQTTKEFVIYFSHMDMCVLVKVDKILPVGV